MKALVAIAVIVGFAPLVAAIAEDGASAPKEERVVCRRVPNPTASSSRLGNQRVCHTTSEWRAIQRGGEEGADLSTQFHDNRAVADGLSRSNRPN